MNQRINQFFFLRPWVVQEDVLSVMMEVIARKNEGIKLSNEEIAAKIGNERKNKTNTLEIMGDMAVVPVHGIIAKRMSMVNNISQPEGTSVEEIMNNLNAALEDPNVKSIILDIDSPGGSSDGVLELADFIFNARKQKPIQAFTDGTMASAAYWIGSSADKVFATKGADVGSIGVYAVTRDYSIFEHTKGIKTSIIKAGKFKAAGHPSKPMTDDDMESIQEMVNDVYDNFVEAIGRNRGMNMQDSLKVANGKVFSSKKALTLGLIDSIETRESVFSSQSGKSGKPRVSTEAVPAKVSDDIDNKSTKPLSQADQPSSEQKNKEESTMSQEMTIERLKADHKPLADSLFDEGKQAGIKEGKTQGASEAQAAEQLRVKGITESMPKAGMEAIAISAIKNGLSVEAAKDEYLKAIRNAAQPSPGGDDNPEKNKIQSKKMTPAEHLTAAKEYQSEERKKGNKCSIEDALKATAPARDKK